MDFPKKTGSTPLAATLAVTLSAAACADHNLPPNPVPNADLRRPIPGWFDPNAKFNVSQDTKVYIEGKIVFDTARATIRPESQKTLEQLLKFLQERPDVTRLRVEGHTDSRADDEYNQELSAKRSLAVCHWLVERGVDNIRLVAAGYGERSPIGPNELAEGRQENRRTEFHVMEINGRPFGPTNALDGGTVLTVLSAEELERLRNPPKVAPPVGTAFIATGNEVKMFKPVPRKLDEAEVVTAPIGDSPGDAGDAAKKGEPATGSTQKK
jgi:outer membrane protein OmpA-like peptidoglycan-associated protein